MKSSRIFLSIAMIVALLAVVISCDVYDGTGSGDGKLFSFIKGNSPVDEEGIPDEPDQDKVLKLTPKTNFVFFGDPAVGFDPIGDQSNCTNPADPNALYDIHIYIPKTMVPDTAVLYAMVKNDALTARKNRYSAAGFDVTGTDFQALTITAASSSIDIDKQETSCILMDLTVDNPFIDGDDTQEYFYIKFPTNLGSNVASSSTEWYSSATPNLKGAGVRIEFTKGYQGITWNDRLNFVSGAPGFASLPYTSAQQAKDAFVVLESGDWWYRICLRYDGDAYKKYFKPK